MTGRGLHKPNGQGRCKGTSVHRPSVKVDCRTLARLWGVISQNATWAPRRQLNDSTDVGTPGLEL
ncbi:hypothetical protein SBA3_2650029 [Candidatus Sulfopaludibacter sp. SbA3]|nr:hypothetical protein SBA3_2650029 [Candidatus Sulfopaludibacter sp. SbA3]